MLHHILILVAREKYYIYICHDISSYTEQNIQENLLDAAQVSKLYGKVWHPDRFPAPHSAGNRPHTYAASTPASPDRPRAIFIRQFP